MIRRVERLLVLLLVSIAGGSASAQSWEASGFAGFTPSVALEPGAGTDRREYPRRIYLGCAGRALLHAALGCRGRVDAAGSALEVGRRRGRRFLCIALAQLHANVVYQFGDDGARLRPFVFGGAGATFFFGARSRIGHEGVVRTRRRRQVFSVGSGRPARAVPLQADLAQRRSRSGLCNPFGFCQAWLRPIELGAAVVIRF